MRDTDLTIDKDEVLRYLGHTGQELDGQLQLRIDELCGKCLELARPDWCYGFFAVREIGRGVLLPGPGITLRGMDIRRHLEGSGHCAVMAATIGIGVEQEFLRLECTSVSDALIFNAACTALVEAVCDRCEEEIRAVARGRGRTCGGRYSPGYGDLPIEQQPELLGLINAGRRLGITLNDSFMMIPRKSVTAILGIFPPGKTANSMDRCSGCRCYDNCLLRKEGKNCGKQRI